MSSCKGCDWYHESWSKLRAVGAVVSAEQHRDWYIQELDRIKPEGVMITGTSDDAMLRIVHQCDPKFVYIVDKCRTPLEANLDYAREHGLDVCVWTEDILEYDMLQIYDVVVSDCIFSFIPEDKRVDYIKKVSSYLKQGGRFITVNRVRQTTGEQRFTEAEKDVLVSKVPDDLVEVARTFADNFTYHPMNSSIVNLFAQNGFEAERIEFTGENTDNSAPSTTGDARRIFMTMRKL